MFYLRSMRSVTLVGERVNLLRRKYEPFFYNPHRNAFHQAQTQTQFCVRSRYVPGVARDGERNEYVERDDDDPFARLGI